MTRDTREATAAFGRRSRPNASRQGGSGSEWTSQTAGTSRPAQGDTVAGRRRGIAAPPGAAVCEPPPGACPGATESRGGDAGGVTSGRQGVADSRRTAQSEEPLGHSPTTFPPAAPTARVLRRRNAYSLRQSLRSLNRERCRQCGYKRIAADVIISSVNGRAHYDNVLRCGSVWECPVCMVIIKLQRAREVQAAVDVWGRERVLMVTLTTRHGLGDDLREIRDGVSTSWSKLISGAPYGRFKARHGMAHYIRALEVTHGPNGFHPHIHVLVFLEHEPTSFEISEMQEWLSDRWADKIRRVLGDEHVPSRDHGVRVTRVVRADYIQKLGLELSDPGTKRASEGYRTPLQVATDFRDTHSATDARIWQAYTRGMKGARQLTWSNGSRKSLAKLGTLDFIEAVARCDFERALKLRENVETLARVEKTDEELVQGECDNEKEIIRVDAATWSIVRQTAHLPPRLLELAESGGRQAVAEEVQQLNPEVSARDEFEVWASQFDTG